MSTTAPELTIALADYDDPADGAAIVGLLDAYARDPMGGGEPLADTTRDTLVDALASFPGAFSLIARLDDTAVGLANCFTGFSTFAAAPLVNIHDMAVLPAHRGKGVGRALMQAVEAEALKRGACKVTLEVLGGNDTAKALYRSCGYGDYSLDPETGTAQFWQKTLI
ncbi:GNAT family N-acetyltransferase [Aurantiacibacter gangjinensis]|uniref:GNAT family N-acetyltransferase n=1 Tax=Aurantiacibacter gangjinensis TaxID=502682 RepID=UPI00090A4171|nr:GNAT family N-acetyltransferase [Aurantiacibacter gangjinensis]APE27461.1 putative acetyltransferase [Aurantiacibacter gangjinensis]